LSPGTALDAGLGQEQNNFLAAWFEASPGATGPTPSASEPARKAAKPAATAFPVCAIALLDLSTGEFRAAEFSGSAARQQAADEILMAGASEILCAPGIELPAQFGRIPARTQ